MLAERVSDAGLLRTSSAAAHRAGAKYDGLIAKAKNVSATKTIVVHPCDEASLRPIEAAEAGIIVPILVGPATKITAIAREHKLDISP
jgi:phosphate acetyltransferase